VKITRRQLRKLIRESVYVDPEGVAVDAAADTLKQFKRFDKIVDYLLELFPAQREKLSVLLKSDDPTNQEMGLSLIESLAMMVDNEEEVLKLVNELRQYMKYFEIMDAGIDKPDSPMQYPKLEAMWPKIKSALLQYALKAVRENFDVLLKNAVNYAAPTSPGYAQGWQVRTTFDIIDLIKNYPKGASYVKIAKQLGKNRVLKEIVNDAIYEPMGDSDISSLANQVTGTLYPDWFDNFTSSSPRGFED
jgi:hypothetical protein